MYPRLPDDDLSKAFEDAWGVINGLYFLQLIKAGRLVHSSTDSTGQGKADAPSKLTYKPRRTGASLRGGLQGQLDVLRDRCLGYRSSFFPVRFEFAGVSSPVEFWHYSGSSAHECVSRLAHNFLQSFRNGSLDEFVAKASASIHLRRLLARLEAEYGRARAARNGRCPGHVCEIPAPELAVHIREECELEAVGADHDHEHRPATPIDSLGATTAVAGLVGGGAEPPTERTAHACSAEPAPLTTAEPQEPPAQGGEPAGEGGEAQIRHEPGRLAGPPHPTEEMKGLRLVLRATQTARELGIELPGFSTKQGQRPPGNEENARLEPPQAPDWEALDENPRHVLVALFEMKALPKAKRVSGGEVAKKALNLRSRSSVEPTLQALQENGHVDGRKGRGGGWSLTEKGKTLVERNLRKQA